MMRQIKKIKNESLKQTLIKFTRYILVLMDRLPSLIPVAAIYSFYLGHIQVQATQNFEPC